MAAFEELNPRFASLDTQVLSVLVNNIPTLQAWVQGLNTSFPALSDFWPHGKVSLLYDVLRSEGIAERALFVIDKQGIIRYMDIHDINTDPGMNAILETLKDIEGK
jgi:peroxiredoxin (alkyl hydroperoxide reductase subunit C)